ncbi:MAG TPA: 4-aminobutyrate--2-oxoglutarate transaminase [Candidatus Angelobacter sp.]|jgi:4-aminobutyrate aminotransferase/(S)-3-amino-2-methylpropionate transaminase|nr:4-aminobutyrate--2-oxoglutarate transaminase [Candidatus Angelobacter sp.]
MASIRLRTAIPGPRSQALNKRREQAVPRGLSQATPVYVAQTSDALIEDVDGNILIDLAGGIGCLNVGHRHSAVTSAIHQQVDRFLHTCAQVTPYEDYITLAERINQLAPGDFAKKTFFVNTGAEAVENAVKIARAYTKRPAIICFEDAFHGRTLLGLALTSKTHPYKAGFEPFPSEIYRIPYAYCYRCSYGKTYPECKIHCGSQAFDEFFRRNVAQENVAAIIVEPVLGEGGFVVPPPEFFARLRAVCDKHGIVLIADEVQTGFARTGAMFACERFGLVPDILITAKSLGGGLPLAAVTGKVEIMDAAGPGGLGGTFAGNPVSCAAGLAVIDAIEKDRLCDRAEQLGEHFMQRARAWQQRWSIVGEVRGLGGMCAIELVQPGSRTPAAEETNKITKYCYEHGVVALSAGSFSNVIRVLMPLVITDAQFDEALDVLEAAIAATVGAKTESVHAVH